MILWLILFLLIVAISFILAYQSMRDFQVTPTSFKLEHSLFLIRNPQALTEDLLTDLYKKISGTSYIFSLERLFKGSRSALVIFGPKPILADYTQLLNLLELEEYSNVSSEVVTVWEIGSKDQLSLHLEFPNIFKNIPVLDESEQLWWQVILQAKTEVLWPSFNKAGGVVNTIKSLVSKGLSTATEKSLQKMLKANPQLETFINDKNSKSTFSAQIRVAVMSAADKRRLAVLSQLENIDNGKLTKLPRPFSNQQLLNVYQQRTKLPMQFEQLNFTTDEICKAIGV